jgi:Zn-dependent protease
MISLIINIANLLPAFPLDGGCIMKALVEMVTPDWGSHIAHGLSLCVAGGALWWAMTHGFEITALVLLGILGTNFTLLRSRGRSPLQPA